MTHHHIYRQFTSARFLGIAWAPRFADLISTPLHAGEKSLADAAKSMCDACGIRDGDILVGSSLGGMVSCEITKIRRIPLLFLVGSTVRKDEVSSLLSTLHPLAQFAPGEWVRVSAAKIPLEFTQMFAGIEASFVRAMCAAIFAWEGSASPDSRVVRIHGRYDVVIPPPAKPDLLLNGGHLISMTHAEQCASYVADHMRLKAGSG